MMPPRLTPPTATQCTGSAHDIALSPRPVTPLVSAVQCPPSSVVCSTMAFPEEFDPTAKHMDEVGHEIPLSEEASVVENWENQPKQPVSDVAIRTTATG